MPSHCLKYGKNRESKNPKLIKINKGRIMVLSKCAVCSSKISKFFEEQDARRVLTNLFWVKIPILSDIPISNTLF